MKTSTHTIGILATIIISVLALSPLIAQRPYITIWNTENINVMDGKLLSSDTNQISIPAHGTYEFQWEEVGNPSNSGTGIGSEMELLTLPHSGIYRLFLTPITSSFRPFNRIYFDDGNYDMPKLLEIEQWGDIEWSSFESAYSGTENLIITATDIPNLQKVKNMSGAFVETTFSTIPRINEWDVSNIELMTATFAEAINFNDAINNWDVGNVRRMDAMFANAKSFNQPLSDWDVSNVEDLSALFRGAESFNQPLDNWNVSNVRSMMFMFIDASSFDQSLETWTIKLNMLNIPSFGTSLSLSNSGMSCKNYSKTLLGWANNPAQGKDINIEVNGIYFSSEALEARVYLEEQYNWRFIGDKEGDCALTPTSTETTHELQLHIYPNPTTDIIHISGLNDGATLQIIDIAGRILKTVETSAYDAEINLSDLNSGIYFLRIASANGAVVTRKVVKQ